MAFCVGLRFSAFGFAVRLFFPLEGMGVGVGGGGVEVGGTPRLTGTMWSRTVDAVCTHMCVNNTDPHLQNHTCICRWVEWKRQAQTMRKRGHWKGWRRRPLLFLGSGGAGWTTVFFFVILNLKPRKRDAGRSMTMKCG